MFPEGLSTLLLALGVITVSGTSLQSSDWTDLITPVGVIAFVAALCGSLLAKLRVIDSIAHLISIALGSLIAFSTLVWAAGDVAPAPRDRVRPIVTSLTDWYLGRVDLDGREYLLVSLLMGLIVWLVSYLAAWSLFRRGWLLAAILLPGFLMLINIGYAPNPDRRMLALFAVLGLMLIARVNLYLRQVEWRMHRIAAPSMLAGRMLTIGAVIAIVATSAGWRASGSFSQAAFQPLIGEVSSTFVESQERLGEWLRDTTGQLPAETQGSGSYTSFDDAFSVGGPLNLSDQEQVLVFADGAPYLAAQRYDAYSGRGWASTVEDTFNNEGPDGRRYSPEMTFRANQPVALSSDVTQDRTPTSAVITPLIPSGPRLYSINTYVSSSIGASVRMSWVQLTDQPYALAGSSRAGVPPDLQRIFAMLDDGRLQGDDSPFGPLPDDPEAARSIQDEASQLALRFLNVRWTADDEGVAETLYVTGQVPVYDDVEAVFGQRDVPAGDSYEVAGSASMATASDLGSAGRDYPDWLANRYLVLPESVTPRTIELANTITSGTDDPYEQVKLIEAYLRTTIAYDESVEAPPDDADMVDYLLFERQRGYCEYSASAMAVMLRAIGIPSRMVVGFYPGDYDAERGGYLYLQRNAHAWTEAYFPGYGWIPFEPTSSQPTIDEGDGEAPDPAEETPPVTVEPPVEEPAASPPVDTGSVSRPPDTQPTVIDDQNTGGTSPALWISLGLLGAVAVTAVGGWIMWSHAFRHLPPTGAMYLRVRRLAGWLNLGVAPNATPREFGARFGHAVPAARPHVDRIVHIYELDQFGPTRADNRLVASAVEAWMEIRRLIPNVIMSRIAPRARDDT